MRCRCAHFQPKVQNTKSSLEPASAGLDLAYQSSKPVRCSSLHQPSCIGNPLQSKTCTKPSSPATLFSMIRRSQRETAKNQSSTKTASTNSETSINFYGGAGAILPGQAKPPRTFTASLKSQHLHADSLSVKLGGIMSPRLSQSEFNKAVGGGGGGRHPHPPSANNTKLKHKCPFDGCPWRFATPYKLRRHIKSHTKETPYLCKECGRGFSVRYNLLMHIQTIHSQPQKFKCPVRGCKDAFHSQSRLNGHLRRIHKNNWKSLQGIKDSSKANNSRGSSTSSTSSTDSSDSVLDSNTTAVRKSRLSNTPYKCPHCEDEFSSKAKFGAHAKYHTSGEKALFKCSVQDCGKVFSSQDKFTRHEESHSKSSKQFCCPHKNCNRIFLRQTHLRNHLKIHTQDHQFVCPVLDCSQKFASESAYNVHLNTHINYGYSCPHPSCDITFLSRKRLAIHTQVIHGALATPQATTGSETPLLEGIQPHLGGQLVGQDPSLLSLSGVSHSSTSKTTPIKCVLDKEFIKHIDLPGLSADDIEAVLSENEDWSGEQIDQFLRSAIDLSEIESKLFSMAGYESDSGYSTFDVSPITSTAPVNLTFSGVEMVGPASLPPLPLHPHQCPPSLLGLMEHSNLSPMFNNPPFISLSLHPPPPPLSSSSNVSSDSASPLTHGPITSPCNSDGGFFSPTSGFASLNSTPSHDSFFPSHSPMSMYPPAFPQPQDFPMPDRCNTSNANIFPINGPSFPDIQSSGLQNVGLPIPPGIFMHDLNPATPLPCSVDPSIPRSVPASGPFMDRARDETVFPGGVHVKAEDLSDMISGMPLGADDIMPIMKKEEGLCEGDGSPLCIERKISSNFTDLSPSCTGFPVVVKTEPGASGVSLSRPLASSTSSSSRRDSENTPPQRESCTPGSSLASIESDNTDTSCSKKLKSSRSKSNGKNISLKGKKKTQWPRSMNRANLLAFRQRILNKLKKGQEVATDPLPQAVPLSIVTTENPSSALPSSSSPPVPPLIKCEASSLNAEFEVQVMYERNLTTKQCQNGMACPQGFLLPLHAYNSDGRLNNSDMEDKLVSSPCLFDEEKCFSMVPENTDNILLDNFNPDVLLSSNLVDMVLDGMGFKFDAVEEEEASDKRSRSVTETKLDEMGSFTHSSSLKDRPCGGNIDGIHNLLTESGDCGSVSPSSSSLGSPDLTPVLPLTNQFDFGDTCSSSPASSISRSASLDGCSSPPYHRQNQVGGLERKRCFSCDTSCLGDAIDDEGSNGAFHFPEILSVEGSMVLDGVNVLGEGGECDPHLDHHVRDTFLNSTHDPLLASDRHSVALFDAI